MPKLFLFAIGGTGERVLRSLNMVLASGAPTFDNYEVFPIIIDYDKDNADKDRTVKLLQNYAAIHYAAFTRHGQTTGQDGRNNQFFAAKLSCLHGLTNYVFPFQPATPNEKFREHIGYDNLAGDTMLTKDLLKSLYDESDRADTELNLNMTVGFKGNPNIGSVVFHTIKDTAEFRIFNGNFQPEAGDKVVIIGSLFGGTGASGIPEIVKAINDRQPDAKAAVSTILVLPYFAPMERRGGAIKASRFNSKTKAALSFYDDSGLKDMVGKIYYVGDYYSTVIPYSEGGNDQINNANIVELIAVMMIEHFVAGRGGRDKEFKFSPDANIVVLPGQRNGQRLFMTDFDQTSIDMVLRHLVQLAIAMKFYHDEISPKKTTNVDFHRYLDLNRALDSSNLTDATAHLSALCAGLKEFYGYYQAWLKEIDFEGIDNEIPANKHRLGLCDMTRSYGNILLKEDVANQRRRESRIINNIQRFFGGSEESIPLDYDFLCARMNDNINPYFNNEKSQLKEGYEPEWVFADILHRTSENAFDKRKISGE